MNNGLYTAFLGMRARQRALDATANNIANAATTGFKADRLLYRSIESAQGEADNANAPTTSPVNAAPATDPSNAVTNNAANATQANLNPANASANASPQTARALGVTANGTIDFSTGAIRQTGRSLDVALNGDGLLVVQTARGERYTRAGALTLDASGQLVTQSGDLVAGERGPITVPPGNATIGEDGTVSVGGQTIDRLKLVRFTNTNAALLKEGHSLFVATGTERPQEAVGTRVMQGALESSNVNAVTEMAAMMQNNREFETLQRSITLLMNDLGRKVAGEIGKI